MLIGELAKRAGVSARALRHYEEKGLLAPRRDANGYRHYDESAVATVAQLQIMLAAGLNAATIRRYLDCVRTGEHDVILDMCPELRKELDSLAARLAARQAAVESTRRRLDALYAGAVTTRSGPGKPVADATAAAGRGGMG
ncbi:MerR family DNA-binding transcriptional regulator [Nocardia gamkensis]|uniref:MerR family DNA-binding transcriptional regulator n=1 Tax=Nocardia gamkensis TaxID=352869 RepID=A0A7X6L482_9NOCA|nr:MerR family DNA-binding transcriptional regulator [Nocardia gamkensis]NKY27495.1 MerR family DNA-binding transcriptional regulator [Nocardia gamkensis]NQE66025.1 Redox-sensitive transcriptional activator SoxR [Nocardia gamkensis]